MPYINKEDRKVYTPIIKKVIGEILAEKDLLVRLELFGGFCKSLTLGYACYASGLPNGWGTSQNATVVISLIRSKCRTSDYFEVAGHLNYVISAVYWGIEGEAEGAEKAKYGFRSMAKVIILEIMDELPSFLRREQANVTQARIRLIRMLRGVLSDVVDENYRRLTAAYEDSKVLENGDVWPLVE